VPGWLIRLGRRREVRAGVLAVLLVSAVLSGRWRDSGLTEPVAFTLTVLGIAPLMTLPRWPAGSLTLVLAANSGFVLAARLAWSPGGVLCWLLALALFPFVLGRRAGLIALAAVELVVLAAAVLVPPHLSATPWDATVAEALAAVLAWFGGLRLRELQRIAGERATAAARLRVLEESDALSRSRVEVARELHDVVAHHVSLIAVRAATARYALPGLPDPAGQAFDEIAEQARTALTELRTVLGVLRVGAGEALGQAPQPGLGDIGELVRRVRASGGQVALTVHGSQPVPASVQLCGYRIVQEALTNAGRHAPGAAVTVNVERQPGALTVRVRNDGPARPAAGPSGAGYGLIGMRERVSMLGGRLDAGPEGNGFAITAVLPLGAAAGGC
jgi:signal transduction histidine kinase